MEYRKYINRIDALLLRMDVEAKNQWIRQKAREVSAENRTALLASLSVFLETAGDEDQKDKGGLRDGLLMTPGEMRNWCDMLAKSEEMGLKRYFSMEDDYDISGLPSEIVRDPYELMDTLEKMICACRQLIDRKSYQTAWELLKRICRLRIPLHHMEQEYYEYDGLPEFDEGGDYELGDELDLYELIRREYLGVNGNDLARSLLYACYQAEDGADRMDELFALFQGKLCGGLVMEDILSFGPEELYQLPRFMMNWKTYLTYQEGEKASELLAEVYLYQGGLPALREAALQQVKRHPALYRICCQRLLDTGDDAGCMDMAKQALGVIKQDKRIRADIADLGAFAAVKAGDVSMLSVCRKEAFLAEPSGIRLLRLYQTDTQGVRDELIAFITSVPTDTVQTLFSGGNKREKYGISDFQKNLFQILLGDFNGGLENLREEMKRGYSFYEISESLIWVMLLLMKRPDGSETRAELASIRETLHGLGIENGQEDEAKVLLNLCRITYPLTEKQCRAGLDLAKAAVSKVTEVLVGGSHRSRYHMAAELIVMLGLVQETWGQKGALRTVTGYFISLHPRKSAFRQELQAAALPEKG